VLIQPAEPSHLAALFGWAERVRHGLVLPLRPGYECSRDFHCAQTKREKRGLAMSQAVVDPIELRRFAHNLKQFNQELEERMKSLRGQLQSLGATWRDQEHKKFLEDFEHHMKAIAKYVEATNDHAPFLLRKAERIEEYLQQR
jgi:uncharacterized protein YukE